MLISTKLLLIFKIHRIVRCKCVNFYSITSREKKLQNWKSMKCWNFGISWNVLLNLVIQLPTRSQLLFSFQRKYTDDAGCTFNCFDMLEWMIFWMSIRLFPLNHAHYDKFKSQVCSSQTHSAVTHGCYFNCQLRHFGEMTSAWHYARAESRANKIDS